MSEEMKMSKCVIMGGKVFPIEVIGPNPNINGSFYVRYSDGGTDSFKPRYILDLIGRPIPSDLAATQELLRLKELECEALVKDKKELLNALRCSVDYISESPCDPDITGRQIVAYDTYVGSCAIELLERLG